MGLYRLLTRPPESTTSSTSTPPEHEYSSMMRYNTVQIQVVLEHEHSREIRTRTVLWPMGKIGRTQ